MDLGFSEEINGKPSFFIDRIWTGLLKNKTGGISQVDYQDYGDRYKNQFGKMRAGFREEFEPKLHTIRSGKRWSAGDLIHFMINPGTAAAFRFTPVLKCRSVQDIIISHTSGQTVYPVIYIEGREISSSGSQNILNQLVTQDGFDSITDFFGYFNTDFTGQIVHWTELKY